MLHTWSNLFGSLFALLTVALIYMPEERHRNNLRLICEQIAFD